MHDDNVHDATDDRDDITDSVVDHSDAVVDDPDVHDDVGDATARMRWADETGAQAMEYAMLGGAGVASVSFLTWLMRQPWFADAMEGLFSGFLRALTDKIAEMLPILGGVV